MAYFIGYKAQWLPLLFDGKKFFASSIMPMLALSMFTVATVARFTRTSLLEVLDSDYMLLAESKESRDARFWCAMHFETR